MKQITFTLNQQSQKLDFLTRRLISPAQQIENQTMQIRQFKHRLDMALQRNLQAHHQQVLSLKNSLAQLNPHNVLARGYAIVHDAQGELINNSKQTKPGSRIKLSFHQGEAMAVIDSTRDA